MSNYMLNKTKDTITYTVWGHKQITSLTSSISCQIGLPLRNQNDQVGKVLGHLQDTVQNELDRSFHDLERARRAKSKVRKGHLTRCGLGRDLGQHSLR